MKEEGLVLHLVWRGQKQDEGPKNTQNSEDISRLKEAKSHKMKRCVIPTDDFELPLAGQFQQLHTFS